MNGEQLAALLKDVAAVVEPIVAAALEAAAIVYGGPIAGAAAVAAAKAAAAVISNMGNGTPAGTTVTVAQAEADVVAVEGASVHN